MMHPCPLVPTCTCLYRKITLQLICSLLLSAFFRNSVGLRGKSFEGDIALAQMGHNMIDKMIVNYCGLSSDLPFCLKQLF